jgi:hypothetical protein
MQLSAKPFLITICAIVFIFISIAVYRNVSGSKPDEPWLKPLVLGLFFLFGLAIVPLFVKGFIQLQQRAGNHNNGNVAWIRENGRNIVFAVWAVFIAGLLIALPFMRKDGFFATEANAQPTQTGAPLPKALYPVVVKGRWGYMNQEMKMIIPPQYAAAGDFKDGRAPVRNDEQAWGFIDTSGALVIGHKYERILPFSEGVAAVMKDKKFGFIDITGKELTAFIYEDASSFSESLACVRIDEKNGFIDKAGRMVIAPQFERACWASDFSAGLAMVYKNDKAGYINARGEYVIHPAYTYASAFSEGLALVQPAGQLKYGYINTTGTMVIAPKYELSLPFKEGLATVKLLDSNGEPVFAIIDKTGRQIGRDLPYLFVGIFNEGLAGVENNAHQWGFIDRSGKEVISPVYAGVTLFKNGFCRMQTGSLFGGLKTVYINREGRVVWKE